jgi:hypothetical protein
LFGRILSRLLFDTSGLLFDTSGLLLDVPGPQARRADKIIAGGANHRTQCLLQITDPQGRHNEI